MKPTIGRIVGYTTTPNDKLCMKAASKISGGCNEADVLPAIVVAVWSEDIVNLRVVADGNLDLWITSSHFGTLPGQWHWPDHVE